jgi:hypothetical protein
MNRHPISQNGRCELSAGRRPGSVQQYTIWTGGGDEDEIGWEDMSWRGTVNGAARGGQRIFGV